VANGEPCAGKSVIWEKSVWYGTAVHCVDDAGTLSMAVFAGVTHSVAVQASTPT